MAIGILIFLRKKKRVRRKKEGELTLSVASVQGPSGSADWDNSCRAATTVQRRWQTACSNTPRGQLSGESGTKKKRLVLTTRNVIKRKWVSNTSWRDKRIKAHLLLKLPHEPQQLWSVCYALQRVQRLRQPVTNTSTPLQEGLHFWLITFEEGNRGGCSKETLKSSWDRMKLVH